MPTRYRLGVGDVTPATQYQLSASAAGAGASASTLVEGGADGELLADVRWQTGTLLDGAGSNNTASSNILRDADNSLKAGDAIGNHNCSSSNGWWNYLAVTPPDYDTWLDEALYPYDSNVYWHQRHRRGCGHCVFSNLFPVPEGGEFWAWTYDEVRTGSNVEDYDGDHPHCNWPGSINGGVIEVVHGGWSRQDQYTNGGAIPSFLAYTNLGGATPVFIPKTQQSGDNPIPVVGYTWYRHQTIMAWESATEFRFLKKISRIPADGGAVLCNPQDWYQRDGGGTRLTSQYALSNFSTRNASSGGASHISYITLGNGQGADATTWATYGDTQPMRIGVAGFRAALVGSDSAFLAGLTS